MAILNLGQVRPVNKGEWSSTIAYKSYDFIHYNGSVYLALQDVPINYVPDSQVDYWVIFGAKGEDGVNGEDGVDGVDGENGAQGIQGIQGEQGEPYPITDAIDLDKSDIAASAKAVSLVNTATIAVKDVTTAADRLGNKKAGTGLIIDGDMLNINSQALASFPTGTKMLFQQSAAPTGWTKLTDSKYENAALRFTTGDASSGGSVTFDNAFKNQTVYMSVSGSVGSTTLSTSQMPSHTHPFDVLARPGTVGDNGVENGATNTEGRHTPSYAGSSRSHSHSLSGASGSASLNLDVKYVDCIVARKA